MALMMYPLTFTLHFLFLSSLCNRKFKGKSPSELMEGFSTRILNGGSSVNYEAALNGHSNGIDDDSSLDSTAQSPAQDKSQEEDTFRKTSPERREPQISKKRMSLGSTR